MKNNMSFKLSLMLLVMFLGFSNAFAQKRVARKPAGPNLKTSLEFLAGKIKSEVNYTDSKGTADCPNQSVKKIVYQEIVFSANSNLEMKLTDEAARSACSSNLINSDKVTSKSVNLDEVQVSVPIRQLNSSAIKTGSCQLESGYQRKNGNCFFVSLETFNNLKAFKIEKVNSFTFDEKVVTDKKAVSFTSNQFQIYFSDQETADSVAKAFAQAIKLAGGN